MKRAVPYHRVWPFAIVWILLTGTFLWFGARATYENQLFSEHARHIQGTVLRKFITVSQGRHGTSYTHYIVYAYQTENLLGNCQVVVHGNTYWEFSEGDPIPIKYLPEQPQNNRMDTAPEDYVVLMTARLGVGIGLASLLLGGVLLAYAIKRNKLHDKLITTGLLSIGKITSVEEEQGNRGSVRIFLVFEFRNSQGQLVEGRTWDLNQQQQWYWIKGKSVKIYYDPTDSNIFTVDLEQSQHQL